MTYPHPEKVEKMAEYDSTNSGVFFKPHDDQKLMGSGKLDIMGQESRIVVIKEKISKTGDPMPVIYQRLSPLFPNDKKGNDKAPDNSGPIDTHPQLRIAAWKGEKDGRPYFSLKVSEKQQSENAGGSHDDGPAQVAQDPRDLDDEIPW